MTASRAEILKALLPGLNGLFGTEYAKYNATVVEYVKKCRYGGKYTIYRRERSADPRMPFFEPRSTTIAKGLTKEEADGFLKLLKEPE
jgi:hypothetical protein